MKLATLALLAAWCVACRPAGGSMLKVGGRERHYELFVPTTGTGMPLVIALHGNGSTGPQTEKLTRFDEVAAREQFVVAYPDGIDHHWNDGRPEFASNIDDVAFIAALIDELAARYAIDRTRVYVTGISNGAIMSYRLACELGDRIVAIAPVAGGFPAKIACKPGRPVSVLAINGTEDPLVPYAGGQVHGNRGLVASAADSTAMFAKRAGCGAAGASVDEPDRATDDGTRVRRQTYAGCPPPLAVELVTVDGGGHTWPGGPQYAPKLVIGRASRDFDATERIWQFFVDHTPTNQAPRTAHDAGIVADAVLAAVSPPDARAPKLDKLRGVDLPMSRVCTSGQALVFENDCGCNDALLCEVRGVASATIDVAVRKDPSRGPMCDDCFPMVPGRCALPVLQAGTWTVKVNGAAAFDLVVDAAGRASEPTCWQ